jgi:hypothetical protein
VQSDIGFPFRDLAEAEGVISPEHLVRVPSGYGGPGVRPNRGVERPPSRRAIERALFDLEPGITEVCVHPAIDTPELRSLAPGWAARVDDHDLATTDRSMASLASRAGATLIGYRVLRDLQRAG